MKIAIASDDRKKIASHFGRTQGFLIFDIENGEVRHSEYRVNNFTGHAKGLEGAGHDYDRHAPILDALNDCTVVISRGMGMRIYNDLTQVNIHVVVTDVEDAQQALQLYLKNQLVHKPELGCTH